MSDEKLTEEKLEQGGIKYALLDGQKYFSIEGIKKVHPDVKFNVGNIREDPDIGRCVRVMDVEFMSEFDVYISRSLRQRK